MTSLAYESHYVNDVFAFKETVAEIRQHYEKSDTKGKKQEQLTQDAKEECHHQAFAVAQAATSDIQVVMPEGMVAVDPVKYQVYLGIGQTPDSGVPIMPKETQGELVATALAGAPVQYLQG